jgi:hypothetical protein
MIKNRSRLLFSAVLTVMILTGCAYRLSLGRLEPLPESRQGEGFTVSDDGTVTYTKERLEISLRVMTDEELNRQFADASSQGRASTNPYTFGNWSPQPKEPPPSRFTVFLLKAKNYTYPKVHINPQKIIVSSKNGREYEPLTLALMKEYYYPYVQGYAGKEYSQFDNRIDLLRRTLYPSEEMVFSGQENQGFVLFPKLHDDVEEITVHVKDIALRFDFRGAPTETIDLAFSFHREVRRL